MTGRLKQYLEESGVSYGVLACSAEAYTAQEKAANLHISGKELLKVVMVMADGRPCMAVLPADKRLDLKKLAHLMGARRVSLATEAEFAALFPDCEIGAAPPFGNLYGVEVAVDSCCQERAQVAFLSGTHREAVRMETALFERLVGPRFGDFCQPWH